MDLQPGQLIVWLLETHGNGQTEPITGRVERVTDERVQIRVQNPDGESILHWVWPDSLEPAEGAER